MKVVYANEKNPSRVFELYKRLFELKHRDKFVPEFYGEPKGLIDELEMHQSAVTYAATLRGCCQDLVESKFLSGLSPSLRYSMREQRLGGDNIPNLTTSFSRELCAFLLELM